MSKLVRIALTGGIACGKSLLTKFLNELGIRTIDADDIVHELIPSEERKRLAAVVFKDSAVRKELEAKIHPMVKSRIEEFFAASSNEPSIAVIPLLYETGWDKEYDVVVAIVSDREVQILRMMTTRGYTREEAEARMSAQMSVEEKARRADYVIYNNGTEQELKQAAEGLKQWLMKN